VNPRMDEVGQAVRALFPLLGVRGRSRFGTGWSMVLAPCGGAIAVALDNGREGGCLSFSVTAGADPAQAVARAGDRYAERRRAAA
jgi:hypothetical protein